MRLLLLGVVVLLAVAVPSASATTPPRTCGFMKVHGKKYKVRSHLVSCKNARHWARRVLKGRSGPGGYSCQRYNPQVTSIRFICQRGARDIFAIRQ